MLSNNWARIPCALVLALFSLAASAEVYVSVNIAPPELPVYEQPAIPADGYLWAPGYWAWNEEIQDYYWVPGTWVEPPQPEYLWTPGYWAASDGAYSWRPGYWGPVVGFYGGVNYGYGYGGRGYEGGYWDRGRLYYNRAVVNVGSTRIDNVYNRTVVNNVTAGRASFNGGNGGVRAQPTGAELSAQRDHHIAVTPMQREQEQAARTSPELRATANHGNPPIAATPRAGNFTNPVPAQHAASSSVVERPNPQPRLSAPRPGPDAAPFGPQRHVTTNQELTPKREATPNQPLAPNRPAAPNQITPDRQVTPAREVAPAQNVRPPPPPTREPVRVEPQRQPMQAQPRAPAPPAPPKEQPRPAPPHPDEHEHH